HSHSYPNIIGLHSCFLSTRLSVVELLCCPLPVFFSSIGDAFNSLEVALSSPPFSSSSASAARQSSSPALLESSRSARWLTPLSSPPFSVNLLLGHRRGVDLEIMVSI
ncbi:unnamed protein product, partial [Urochloa humidicola]